MSREAILGHFAEQAMFCEMFGSPFTGRLIKQLGEDIKEGGPTDRLVGQWPTNPRADALSLRVAGALHAAVLNNRDPDLATVYPARNPNWTMDQVWPLARTFLEREHTWVAAFIKSPPQTNETRRSIALLAAFLTFAKDWTGPIDTLEIGASAGLNLNWDRFAYRTASWSWGGPSPVLVETDWNGAAPPVDAHPHVRHRAACDLNPLDIRDAQQLMQLKSYVWPDQADRIARFEGAVALAIDADVCVDRANAADWLRQKLPARAKDAATIVYHSIFLQYPPAETRAAIAAAIEDAGASATETAPLVWIRLEPEALFDGPRDSQRVVLDMITWPGARRRILAYTDGHARGIYVA